MDHVDELIEILDCKFDKRKIFIVNFEHAVELVHIQLDSDKIAC